MTRRHDIAQAAMELVAEGGSHALTHRRIDRRLGLPEGTTSNYARTRRDLVMMVATHIARIAYLREPTAPPPRTVAEATEQLVDAFEQVAERDVDIRARMALTIDCQSDPELYALLTTDSPVRATIVQQARELLDELGIVDSEQRAIDLIAIMNGLFYDRLIGYGVLGTPADAAAVLGAWLTGVSTCPGTTAKGSPRRAPVMQRRWQPPRTPSATSLQQTTDASAGRSMTERVHG